MSHTLPTLHKKPSRNLIIFAVLGLAVLVALYFFVTYWLQNQKKDTLTLYGNVDIRQVDLGFRVPGRLQKMMFEEGDEVKAGDIVAVLDKAPYEASVSTAKGQLQQAEANYARLRQGNRPQEIEEARANVRVLKATYDNAVVTLQRQQEQLKIQGTSRQTYDDAFAKKQEAEALFFFIMTARKTVKRLD